MTTPVARTCLASEPASDATLSISNIKGLTDGDRQRAQAKDKDPFEWLPVGDPDDFVLAALDPSGRIAAWTRFHGEDPADVGRTLLEQGGAGRTLRLMTSEGVRHALAANRDDAA